MTAISNSNFYSKQDIEFLYGVDNLGNCQKLEQETAKRIQGRFSYLTIEDLAQMDALFGSVDQINECFSCCSHAKATQVEVQKVLREFFDISNKHLEVCTQSLAGYRSFTQFLQEGKKTQSIEIFDRINALAETIAENCEELAIKSSNMREMSVQLVSSIIADSNGVVVKLQELEERKKNNLSLSTDAEEAIKLTETIDSLSGAQNAMRKVCTIASNAKDFWCTIKNHSDFSADHLIIRTLVGADVDTKENVDRAYLNWIALAKSHHMVLNVFKRN